MPIVDPHFIKLDPTSSTVFFLEKKGMKLDLGCLAKGYSADKVAQYLKEHGVTSALINLEEISSPSGITKPKKESLADWDSRSAKILVAIIS